MQQLIVGLGNIGLQYVGTRHNIGFEVLSCLAARYGAVFVRKRHANIAGLSLRGRRVTLLQPTTYMNQSGTAVRYWMQQLRIPCSALLVIVDELALPFGKLQLRPKGGCGGHNGLRNIENCLGTNAYARLRFGIGCDFDSGKQAAYVLSPFPVAATAQLPSLVDRATDIATTWSVEGVSVAMNRYNSKQTAGSPPSSKTFP